MKFMRVIIILLWIAACNDKTGSGKVRTDSATAGQNDASPAVVPPTRAKEEDVSGCYLRIRGRDSLLLQLRQSGDQLIGKLRFDNYQFDGSMGTVAGLISGDTIWLWYDFNAEGMRSVREMIFRKEGGALLMAQGEFTIRGDSAIMNHDQLRFTERLQHTDCAGIRRQLDY